MIMTMIIVAMIMVKATVMIMITCSQIRNMMRACVCVTVCVWGGVSVYAVNYYPFYIKIDWFQVQFQQVKMTVCIIFNHNVRTKFKL